MVIRSNGLCDIDIGAETDDWPTRSKGHNAGPHNACTWQATRGRTPPAYSVDRCHQTTQLYNLDDGRCFLPFAFFIVLVRVLCMRGHTMCFHESAKARGVNTMSSNGPGVRGSTDARTHAAAASFRIGSSCEVFSWPEQSFISTTLL